MGRSHRTAGVAGGLVALVVALSAAPAAAEVAPRSQAEGGAAMCYAPSDFAPGERCDRAQAEEAGLPVKGLVCTGDPLVDDPACWTVDPHGLPASTTAQAGGTDLRVTTARGPHVCPPVDRAAGELPSPDLGAAGEHRRGLDRPPRA